MTAKKFSFDIKGNLKNIAPNTIFLCSRISSILMGKEIRTCKLTKSHFPILWRGKEDLLANKTLFLVMGKSLLYSDYRFSLKYSPKYPFSLKAFPILMGKEKGTSPLFQFHGKSILLSIMHESFKNHPKMSFHKQQSMKVTI